MSRHGGALPELGQNRSPRVLPALLSGAHLEPCKSRRRGPAHSPSRPSSSTTSTTSSSSNEGTGSGNAPSSNSSRSSHRQSNTHKQARATLENSLHDAAVALRAGAPMPLFPHYITLTAIRKSKFDEARVLDIIRLCHNLEPVHVPNAVQRYRVRRLFQDLTWTLQRKRVDRFQPMRLKDAEGLSVATPSLEGLSRTRAAQDSLAEASSAERNERRPSAEMSGSRDSTPDGSNQGKLETQSKQSAISTKPRKTMEDVLYVAAPVPEASLSAPGSAVHGGKQRWLEVVPASRIAEVLEFVWKDPAKACFRGSATLHEYVSARYVGITMRSVREYLMKQELHQMGRPQPVTVNQPIVATDVGHLQVDLIKITWNGELRRERLGMRQCDDDVDAPCNAQAPSTVMNVPESTSALPLRANSASATEALQSAEPPERLEGGGGPRPQHLMVIIDVFSKFVWIHALVNKEPARIVHILERMFLQEGPPRILQSDGGGEFVNGTINALCTRYGVQRRVCAPYNSQCDGAVERVNRTVRDAIKRIRYEYNTKNWETQLQQAVFAYNTIAHSTTGLSPFLVQRGRAATAGIGPMLIANTQRAGDALHESQRQVESREGYADDDDDNENEGGAQSSDAVDHSSASEQGPKAKERKTKGHNLRLRGEPSTTTDETHAPRARPEDAPSVDATFAEDAPRRRPDNPISDEMATFEVAAAADPHGAYVAGAMGIRIVNRREEFTPRSVVGMRFNTVVPRGDRFSPSGRLEVRVRWDGFPDDCATWESVVNLLDFRSRVPVVNAALQWFVQSYKLYMSEKGKHLDLDDLLLTQSKLFRMARADARRYGIRVVSVLPDAEDYHHAPACVALLEQYRDNGEAQKPLGAAEQLQGGILRAGMKQQQQHQQQQQPSAPTQSIVPRAPPSANGASGTAAVTQVHATPSKAPSIQERSNHSSFRKSQSETAEAPLIDDETAQARAQVHAAAEARERCREFVGERIRSAATKMIADSIEKAGKILSPPLLNVGDNVRVSTFLDKTRRRDMKLGLKSASDSARWSEQVYVITKCITASKYHVQLRTRDGGQLLANTEAGNRGNASKFVIDRQHLQLVPPDTILRRGQELLPISF